MQITAHLTIGTVIERSDGKGWKYGHNIYANVSAPFAQTAREQAVGLMQAIQDRLDEEVARSRGKTVQTLSWWSGIPLSWLAPIFGWTVPPNKWAMLTWSTAEDLNLGSPYCDACDNYIVPGGVVTHTCYGRE